MYGKAVSPDGSNFTFIFIYDFRACVSSNCDGINGTDPVMSFEQYTLIFHAGLPEN